MIEMKSFKQYLAEKWTDVTVDNSWMRNTPNQVVRVMRNPHPNILKHTVKKMKEVRYVEDHKGNMYVWNSAEAVHGDIVNNHSDFEDRDEHKNPTKHHGRIGHGNKGFFRHGSMSSEASKKYHHYGSDRGLKP